MRDGDGDEEWGWGMLALLSERAGGGDGDAGAYESRLCRGGGEGGQTNSDQVI